MSNTVTSNNMGGGKYEFHPLELAGDDDAVMMMVMVLMKVMMMVDDGSCPGAS